MWLSVCLCVQKMCNTVQNFKSLLNLGGFSTGSQKILLILLKGGCLDSLKFGHIQKG